MSTELNKVVSDYLSLIDSGGASSRALEACRSEMRRLSDYVEVKAAPDSAYWDDVLQRSADRADAVEASS